MKPDQLQEFLDRHGLSTLDFAETLGLTEMAVRHWVSGKRSIAKPYARLIRLFDRHPKLLAEFGKV